MAEEEMKAERRAMQECEFRTLLAFDLDAIVRHDTEYDTRAWLIYRALSRAQWLGMKCGFRIDAEQPEWPVAYIELPTGQVSWHMPQHGQAWDGHTTEEKFQRIGAWVRQTLGGAASEATA